MNDFKKFFLIFSLFIFLLFFYLFFWQKVKTFLFKDDLSNLSLEENISHNFINNSTDVSQSQHYISQKKKEIGNAAISYFMSYMKNIKNYFINNKTDKIKQNNSSVNEKKVSLKNENSNTDNNEKKVSLKNENSNTDNNEKKVKIKKNKKK
ncbi:hypothetical protein ATP_00128 [Candidatus Phytoplasma mali]|uniref:Uncharacterized protein n=1 Tax=Phytoplasma mali (strain AT) TaxID=482235 RepID=B3R0F1_PHYMT|nr:hypothetical protein [Candidatus Phytoplasma mali]CAP18315.1 hypothetical protein ATP_00128 [Candidatus Phytoplasma mali]